MAIIIHPANSSVFTDDPVFCIVHPILVGIYLLDYGVRYLLVIIRVDHPLECITGQCFEVFQIRTSENAEHSSVHIEQFLRCLCLINKESTRHMSTDLFNDGKSLLV